MTEYNPGSQAERAAIMKDEARMKLRHPCQQPPVPTTYSEIANRPADDLPKPSNTVPPLPPTSPWARDPVPDEPLIDGSGEGDTYGAPIDQVQR
jgi:hypothetical protein